MPGAEIVHSGHLDFTYGSSVADGDSFCVGRLRVRVLETPGHTPESLTFTVADTSIGEQPIMAFTGDTLFVGDTGRVDLLGAAQAPHLAGLLYDSLFHKILPLGDGVLLYPGHGSGSVCGGAIADRDVSSVGLEKLHNPCLNAGGLQAFVHRKLAEEHLTPPYFRHLEEWNQHGSAPIHERLPVPPALSPGEVAERVAEGAVIVDARMPQAFAGGHIPGSYNIWRGGLVSYLGWIVAPERRFVLVLPEGASIEDVTRSLLRIGFDHVDGYLRGGFESWQNQGREVQHHGTIDTADLASMLRRDEDVVIVDVRAPAERAHGTIEGAYPIFVGDLEKRLDALPRDQAVVTMCSVGHRGGIAASVLARHGFRAVYNYLGGYQAWTVRR
jgi:hydroxyacylglutathione hydrolase